MNTVNTALPNQPKPKSDLIKYPRFKELHTRIQQCQELSKLSGEPQCMTLGGLTGAGKTTLAKYYAQSIPPYETERGTVIPVLYHEIPAEATMKGLASTMLESMGDPGFLKGSLVSMTSRLIKLIAAVETEIIILDQFQHLIERKKNLGGVSDWLKMLIKQTNIPFIVVGLPDQVEMILRANPQLSRLFADRQVLRPFSFDLKEQKTVEEFGRFIGYAQKAVGSELADGMKRKELWFRIHYATDGLVGNITNLLWAAARNARENDRVKIELYDLDVAFRDRIGKHLYKKINPFTPDEKGELVPQDYLAEKFKLEQVESL